MKNALRLSGLILFIFVMHSCIEKPVPPTVTTTEATEISYTSAVSGGEVTDEGGESVISKGICWNTNSDPTISDSKTSEGGGKDSFTSNMAQLSPGTFYYVKAYATNSAGTGYGNEITVITNQLAVPVLTTTEISSITQNTAISGGNITSESGGTVTARGICWGTLINPTITNSKTTNGTGPGSFVSTLTGLLPATVYYVRSYATNIVGTSYGNGISFTTASVSVAVVTTSAASLITQTTATSGGNVTSSGGASVTVRGVCWSSLANPTTANSKTTNGSGTGEFTSPMTGLTAGTIYYVRAYTINSVGTAYGNETSFTTNPATVPVLITSAATTITQTTATTGGNVTGDGGASVSEKGVCWSTSAGPVITDSKSTEGPGTGVFTSSMTGLTPGTKYYIRAYATNSAGTGYGNESNFTTNPGTPPVLTTTSTSSITQSTAITGGNITSDGGVAITVRGVCWNTTADPTIADNSTSNNTGTGSFVSNLTGLTPNTKYYIKAYAINSVGIAYGNQVSFTTSIILPVVTTDDVTAITSATTTGGGNVTSEGGAPVTVRGVCWNNATNPTIGNSKTTNGAGTGVFTSPITGLIHGTTYYVRAYATNSGGTAYGNEVSFTASVIVPTLTTTSISVITVSTARSGGNITDDGGALVSDRGICFSTTPDPTTSNNKITNGTGTGSFFCNLSGLAPNTKYYVRAYAANSAGTAYGGELSFTTTTGIPSTPTGISAVSGNSQATISWNSVSDAAAYNIYWSTTTGVTKATGTRITDVTSPYLQTGRINGTTYYYVVTAENGYGESSESSQVSIIPKALDTGFGGIASQYVKNGITYAVHTFTYDANFYPPANLTHARVLLVGSGGNGGGLDWDTGGGGGGGEVKEADVAITGNSMAVTISVSGTTITSFGGKTVINGTAGANGKGGNGGISGNGFAGGVAMLNAGGGGGGGTYGNDGVADNWNPVGGNGGDGVMNDIKGVSTYYGGGGGGGAWTGYSGRNGAGGLGGGGGTVSKNGTPNTGGGGLGASYTSGGGYSNFFLGGTGGSGVVIISYAL